MQLNQSISLRLVAKALIVMFCTAVSTPSLSGVIFQDDFNRPDGIVGNGWIFTTDIISSELGSKIILTTGDNRFGPSLNQGWWSDVLANEDRNDNYFTGFSSNENQPQGIPAGTPQNHRSFFTFDLSSVQGQVVNAELQLVQGYYQSPEPYKTLNFFDVTTDAQTLNYNSGINMDVYDDLGSGKNYGSYIVSQYPSSKNEYLIFDLNETAVNDINSSIGNFFSIGGTIFDTDPNSDVDSIFGGTGELEARLILDVNDTLSPEPPGGASLLLFSGLSSSAPLTVDNFDSSLPTILVTHGWQKGEDQSFGDGNLPRQDTINDILTRLDEEAIDANVVLYNWEGAYTAVAKESYQETYNAGANLGTQLSAILGSDYEQSLHMIGHSHGTGVNGFAVDLLQRQGISVDLFTILDSPMDITSNNPFTNADFPRDFFAVTLDGDAVGYVENYVGDGPLAFGTFIQGAGNLRLPGDHVEVPEIYGSEIVAQDKIKRLLLDTEWPWLTPSRNNIEASSLPKWQGEELQITKANFKDWLTLKGVSYDVTCEELGAADGCRYSDVYRTLIESSPSAVSTELVIPNDVTTFMFDYVFGNTGDGDWISLFFEDDLLWELSGLSISSGLVGTASVDVRDFLGTTGELTFLLNSVGESNLEFAFTNLRFLSASNSVPAPQTLMLLISGFVGLGFARRRRMH